ncbi:hypothetical protein GOODEAATRI_007257 [Goodea atripinnis]|uniref:Uncharacterized protein n=1 Tax=Goodea atripinnis TaxID=208336 RepID=A0ABV0N9N5_9TELE
MPSIPVPPLSVTPYLKSKMRCCHTVSHGTGTQLLKCLSSFEQFKVSVCSCVFIFPLFSLKEKSAVSSQSLPLSANTRGLAGVVRPFEPFQIWSRSFNII